MGIVQIVCIGLVCAILAVTIRQRAPEFAAVIGLGAGIVILFAIMPQLAAAVGMFTEFEKGALSGTNYISTVLKIVGIAYIAEFGSQVCADAGESAIASKIELAGKVLIFIVSVPILLSLEKLISNALPG